MTCRSAIVAFAGIALFSQVHVAAPAQEDPDPLSLYNERITEFQETDVGTELDNLQGTITWGRSYILDTYVDVYQETGDTTYLDHFVELADRVMAARADRTGELDYRGRQTFGWITGGHYTLGVPTVIDDADGNPSLEVTTTLNSYNNLTSIEILPGSSDGTFRLVVRSTRSTPPYERSYDNLTMSNVEANVNPADGTRSYIRVRRVGDEIPAPIDPFTPETSKVVLHGHHTGRTITPIARFCDVVLSSGELADYHSKAEEYLAALRETMVEHDQSFRESYDGTRGWTKFERGIPFWADGIVEPHNPMAASGSAYIHLYRATGEPYFRDRAAQIARLIKDHHIPNPDGTWMYHYWWGQVHEGWGPEDEVSVNTPRYTGVETPENLSHGQLSLNFIVDCYMNDIVFTREDLERWATTAMEVMLVEDEDGIYFTAHVDGDNRNRGRLWNNHVIYGLLSIARELEHEALYNACRTILYENYRAPSPGAGLLSWTRLIKAESVFQQD